MASPSNPHVLQDEPRAVGRYRLLVRIASGGMGTVYLARQQGRDGFAREVALKLTHPHLRHEAGWAKEVIEEAKLAALIRHPNVVPMLDLGDDPQGVFLVMDYVEGDTLASLLRSAAEAGARMPRSILLRILIDALAGLHAAHEAKGRDGQPLGLVHRDFSPQNILVGIDGSARLTDFGIAKASGRAALTESGVIRGKIAYMAPEHVRGEKLDRRADVWAAGVIAWEALSGRRLYVGEQTTLLLRIISETPPHLRDEDEEIPTEIDEAVASALTLERDQRCPSAAELRRKLSSCGAPIATVDEVAAYVQEVSGIKIAELRASIAESKMRIPAALPVMDGADRGVETQPDISLRAEAEVEDVDTVTTKSEPRPSDIGVATVDSAIGSTLPSSASRRAGKRLIPLVAGAMFLAIVGTALLVRSPPRPDTLPTVVTSAVVGAMRSVSEPAPSAPVPTSPASPASPASPPSAPVESSNSPPPKIASARPVLRTPDPPPLPFRKPPYESKPAPSK